METLGLTRLFGGCYSGRRVLVTGHTGFKGSWLALWLKTLGAEVAGLALDPESKESHWNHLGLDLAQDFRVDLRDAKATLDAVAGFQPEVVFHLAAQPLVRRGYREPATTFATNVGGLVSLLDAVRASPSVRAVVNATTDKVYAIQETPDGYREEDPLGSHDPYSTSKACAELVSDCYRSSYFGPGNAAQCVRLATARAGNVIGGGDWGEDRLVPDLVRAVASGEVLRIRNPSAIRPWQHVLEPLSGYLRIGQALLAGEAVEGAWNLGPAADATLSVGEMVERLRQDWPQLRVEHDHRPHPPEAAILTLNCSKAQSELGWHSVWGAGTTLRRTSQWYRAYLDGRGVPSRDDLAEYLADARAAKLEWVS